VCVLLFFARMCVTSTWYCPPHMQDEAKRQDAGIAALSKYRGAVMAAARGGESGPDALLE